jgi:hypothetical protein
MYFGFLQNFYKAVAIAQGNTWSLNFFSELINSHIKKCGDI